jgi:hypothetical protein
VLPDTLEKHCTGAEPILDKNGLASKKAASAHLLLWICRRFSTDDTVLQAFGQLNLAVCIRLDINRHQSAVAFHACASFAGTTPSSFLPPVPAGPLSS